MRKQNLYKTILIFFAVMSMTSCEENETPIFDVQNGRAIAGFVGGVDEPKIIFNPVQDTENIITIGVSTVSNTPRTVQLSIDIGSSTLEAPYFSINTLQPVIEPGKLTTDIVITTLASSVLPPASAVLGLNLDSLEGAEILDNSIEKLTIGLEVKCPTVDISLLAGNYQVTNSTFAGFFEETNFAREVVLGPGENQVTILGGAYLTQNSEEIIVTIDPQTGGIIAIDETKIASQVSFGINNYSFLSGGRVLTCAGIIEVRFDFSGSISGNPSLFSLIKQ